MSKEAAMHSILAELINATSPGNEQMRGVRKLREALPGLLDQYRLHIAEAARPASLRDHVPSECEHSRSFKYCGCCCDTKAAEYHHNIVNLE